MDVNAPACCPRSRTLSQRWNHEARPGDNKWTAGIFARNPDTGRARWFYQWSPHDVFDHDGINEQILLDMDWKGQPRKVLVRPERNGFVYVLDRVTGEVLSATPYHYLTSVSGVDLKTGRLQMVEAKIPKTGQTVRDICPNASGAKDWNPSAYSPQTGLLYIPHVNLCMDVQGLEANYIAGTPYVGMNVRMKAGPGGYPRGPRGLVDQGELPAVERGAGHRRRARLLRHHGRLVQGGRRQFRQGAVPEAA